MHSFLILTDSVDDAIVEAKKLAAEKTANKFDTNIYTFDKAVGIEDVRNLQKTIYLSPHSSPNKVLIIDASKGISIEAQNSMLKTLEEPPNRTILILIVSRSENVLPTIISRCKVIEIKESNAILEDTSEFENILLQGVGERFTLAESLSKDKTKAIKWIEQLIIFVRKKMIEGVKKDENVNSLAYKIVKIDKYYKGIKNTNVNLRLALENLLIEL